jgi:riboflavin biosynthesis pyrimidine reductase
MRLLLPPPGSDTVDIHEHYADGWLDAGGLRMNFVSSLDGAAEAGGLSKPLQTDGDNRIFVALRDLADVILVGAGTARAEGYRSVHPKGARLAARKRHGLPSALPTAVVSASLRLDADADLFTGADEQARTIVLTSRASDPGQRSRLGEVAEVVVCGEGAVEPAQLRRVLADRGLTRILCEGGPSLFGTLSAADVVDELCISITPMLAGPGRRRIIEGPPWDGGPLNLRLASLLEEDGALFGRYRRPQHGRDAG